MLIGITAAIIIAISIGVFAVLMAATAMTRRSIDLDASLEEQPLEQWTVTGKNAGLSSSTQFRLSQ
ncbi:MAG: hypothetical protein IAE81_15810 [Caldilineaceae bacterium]|jgi:hypothetical protein|nr:hypothetical protein [Caldilineaceae bacterium]